MKRVVTTGVVLGRINFGEADRIVTVITPDQGKLRLMAKGVRKSSSKMAGGIELFSTSSLTFIPGKRDISTLVSSRLVTHYGDIVRDLTRTTLAYEVLKKINDSTEDECEQAYYDLLVESLEVINEDLIESIIIEVWFLLQLLRLGGHEPNLSGSAGGGELQPGKKYAFDIEAMGFSESTSGRFTDRHIKMLRLLLSQPLQKIAKIQNAAKICQQLKPLVVLMRTQQM